MRECLWDSDILSEFLKGKNVQVAQRAAGYLQKYKRIQFSIITRYEILRGLKAKNAIAQLARFKSFRRQHQILLLTNRTVNLAADIWAGLKTAGQLIGDNDIFIAATALHHGLTLATGNVAHFSRIPGLTLDDWTQP
jgi:tRNA(fMet)-specific endonuclease VapC